jgi:hypothetical protein
LKSPTTPLNVTIPESVVANLTNPKTPGLSTCVIVSLSVKLNVVVPNPTVVVGSVTVTATETIPL